MSKQKAAILDIGSAKITVMIAERGVNNTFNIFGTGEVEYDGFAGGEFFNEELLSSKILQAINIAQTNSRYKIKKLYIGVPAEFSYTIISSAMQNYNKRKKIKDNDIYALFDKAQSFELNDNMLVINRSPISFELDDGRKVVNLDGVVTSKLSTKVSFIVCDSKFINLVNSALKKTNIYEVEYISSPLAEALYLLEPEIRDNNAILIDIGYITSSVSIVKGEGLMGLKSFSIGGGHITGDIAQCLGIGFSDAETLKRKAVLSLDATEDDFYEVTIKGNISPVSAKLVNDIIIARLDVIANAINKCLISFSEDNISYLPLYLTGGGLCYLKGGKDYISKLIGRNIEVLSPDIPELAKPNVSSTLGLMEMALKQEKSLSKSAFQKFLQLFTHK